LGAYEFYLHDAVEDAIQRRPPLCIDVGAAEGYYTLGLAHRLPGSRHIAYEMVDEFRAILSQSIAKQPIPVHS
jgi:tRNA G46 methylase TrmB